MAKVLPRWLRHWTLPICCPSLVIWKLSGNEPRCWVQGRQSIPMAMRVCARIVLPSLLCALSSCPFGALWRGTGVDASWCGSSLHNLRVDMNIIISISPATPSCPQIGRGEHFRCSWALKSYMECEGWLDPGERARLTPGRLRLQRQSSKRGRHYIACGCGTS